MTTLEPVYLESGSANYKYNNTSYEVMGLYEFDFNHRIEVGVNSFKEVYNLAFQSERNLLKDVGLFDVYEGDKLPEGKKSYAVSFLLQDETKTLADKQIDKIMQKLQQTFEKNLDAVLR